jgi:hypothetical protein
VGVVQPGVGYVDALFIVVEAWRTTHTMITFDLPLPPSNRPHPRRSDLSNCYREHASCEIKQ